MLLNAPKTLSLGFNRGTNEERIFGGEDWNVSKITNRAVSYFRMFPVTDSIRSEAKTKVTLLNISGLKQRYEISGGRVSSNGRAATNASSRTTKGEVTRVRITILITNLVLRPGGWGFRPPGLYVRHSGFLGYILGPTTRVENSPRPQSKVLTDDKLLFDARGTQNIKRSFSGN